MFQTFEYLNPYLDQASIINAQGTSPKALTQNAARVVRVDVLLLSNSDTIVHNCRVEAFNGTASAVLGSVAVPAGAGHAGAAAVDAIALLLPAGLPYLLLPVNGYVAVAAEVAMTGATTLDIAALGGIF